MKFLTVRNVLASLILMAGTQVFALEVHEWGTFTSLVNEEGSLMDGMYHEEEGLPGFVYGLREENTNGLKTFGLLGNGCRPRTKCAFSDVLPFNQFNTKVTQKMETPVIYFYGNPGEKAHVEVGFPDGMISQWYPAATDLNLHQENFKNGRMSWDVTLKRPDDVKQYATTTPHSIWNPARVTKANTIQVNANGTEEERFIFYRGLGEFSVPLKLTLKNIGTDNLLVTLRNESDEKIPSLFYIQSSKKDGVLKSMVLPSLDPHQVKTFESKNASSALNLKEQLKVALMSSGLYADEAMSMINTWNKSYFHTEGERLLYILPQGWTEKILPMKVNPVPEKLTRVLVGRIELFSKNSQKKLEMLLGQKGLMKDDHLLEAKLNATSMSSDMKNNFINQLKD